MSSLLTFFGAPFILFGQIRQRARQLGIFRGDVISYTYELGVRSFWLVISGMAFFGIVMVSIANQQARPLTGSLEIVGPAYFKLLIREFGPIISAILAATRIGASLAGELSTMAETEQLDAVVMSRGDIFADVAAPRMVGAALSILALCVLGTLSASLAAAFGAQFFYHSSASAFLNPQSIRLMDVVSAGFKICASALLIPTFAIQHGLQINGKARAGSINAIGTAVHRGVIDACVSCLFANVILSTAFFLFET